MTNNLLQKLIEIDVDQSIQDICQEMVDTLKEELNLVTAACFVKSAHEYTFETSSKGPYHQLINLIAQYLKEKTPLAFDQNNLIMNAVRRDKPTVYKGDAKELDDLIESKIIRAFRSKAKPGEIVILPCRYRDNTEAFVVLVFPVNRKTQEQLSTKDYLLTGEQIAKIFNEKLIQENTIASILGRVKNIVVSIANQNSIPEIVSEAMNLIDANVFFNTTVLISAVDDSFGYRLKSDSKFIKFADNLVKKYALGKTSKKTFLHKNLMNKAYKTQKTIFTPDVESVISPPLPKSVARYIARHMKTQEIAVIPCSGTSGVMAILVTSTTTNFTPIHKKLLDILAREIGYAIENKLLLKDAHDEKNQFISIIDHSSDGIIVFEEDKLIYVSPKMSELTEYTVEEIEASGDGTFLVADEEKAHVARMIAERKKLKKKNYNYFSKIRTKAGNIVPVEVTTTSFERRGKHMVSVTFRNMSRTNEAVEKLENLYSNQGRFFSEIAHSLKTPFTVIYGLLELEDDNPSTYKETFSMIKEELDTVNKKISDLLKISRMEILDYPINMTSVPLDEFLDAFYVKAKSLGYKYCDKDHHFECSCFKYKKLEKKIKIEADIEVLMDILMTLAENSYIHSPKKGQKPAIQLETQIKNKEINIILKDKGKGIPKSEIEKLFKPFSKKLFKPTGHGIGLPMCKKMVEKMNGKIKIKSKLGAGTAITITFPIKA